MADIVYCSNPSMNEKALVGIQQQPPFSSETQLLPPMRKKMEASICEPGLFPDVSVRIIIRADPWKADGHRTVEPIRNSARDAPSTA